MVDVKAKVGKKKPLNSGFFYSDEFVVISAEVPAEKSEMVISIYDNQREK